MASTYDISIINNDTYNGAVFTMEVNLAPLDLTDALIELQARRKGSDEIIWEIDSDSTGSIGGISITDAVNGVFQIDDQIVAAVPGEFPYDIQFTLASGDVKTYISGTLTVAQDYTHG